MDYISREELRHAMYHAAFETDTDLQKWESGCWIRYKLFENVLEALPSADVAGEQEITLDDVLKYCKEYRLMVISEELFNTLTLMNKLSEGIK